jgi:hypothetical protein
MNRHAEKLVVKFNKASVRRMAEGNAKGAPTQPLFHYTNEQALFGIIKSNTFWFTSIYHMDDDEELSFGFGVSHALLSAAMQREDVHAKTFLKPLSRTISSNGSRRGSSSIPRASARRTIPSSGRTTRQAGLASRWD